MLQPGGVTCAGWAAGDCSGNPDQGVTLSRCLVSPPLCCWHTHCIIPQRNAVVCAVGISFKPFNIQFMCKMRGVWTYPWPQPSPASPVSPVLASLLLLPEYEPWRPVVQLHVPLLLSCGVAAAHCAAHTSSKRRYNFNLYNTEYSDCSKVHICKYSSEHGRNQHNQHTRLETMTTPESASKECLFIIHNGAAKHLVLGITSLSIQWPNVTTISHDWSALPSS